MALQPGDVLHERYQILAILGQGGMGSVYHALDTTLNIEVAIKENLFSSTEYAEQFKQEARLLALLRHPNLPRVTDYFVIENQGQYLVMDYIEGEDLKIRIEREGKISVEDAVVIGLALCDALEYLHSQKPPVVHRDIKPGNVRITPQGHVFLVDFGLAKIGGGDQRTVTGAQAVTPGFSPPEQYGTSHTAPHSDIYSLGATLYMALSGEAPPDAFERALSQAELRPLDEINPEVPPALARIIETAMALQASERFRSAAEMKAALLSLQIVPDQQKHLQDHAWTIAPPPGVTGWRTRPQRVEPGAPPPGEPPSGGRHTTGGSKPGGGRPTGGGKKQPSAPKKQPSTPPETADQPPRRRKRRSRAWLWLLLIAAVLGGWYSYDPVSFTVTAATLEQKGQALWQQRVLPYLAQVPAGKMLFGQAAGAPTATLVPVVSATALQPSATVAAASPTSTRTSLPTATPTLTPSPAPTSTVTPTPTITPTLAPTPLGNSGQLAFASAGDDGVAQIWLTSTQGSLLGQLTQYPGGACQPAWLPDGEHLVFIAPCEKEKKIYLNTQLYLLDVQSRQYTELTSPEWGGYDPAVSPDGRYIVFTSLRDGVSQLYLLEVGTGEIAQLFDGRVLAMQPAWSPDGRYIAFVAPDTNRIWVAPFDLETGKAGEPQPFSRSGNKANAYPTWAGNGSLLVYNQMRPNETLPYLVKAPFDQNGLQEIEMPVLGLAMRSPAASPDGRWIAFEGWKGINHDIYLMSINGSQTIQLTTSPAWDFDPAWRPHTLP